ncbi:translation initiation factor IF-2-like [Trachypithecus francoisi]|uniref:translation initiation factor IF-2-like n=1 Tax=Trachypithecus francoisi TaxID=54180 RepID=UPI00141B8B9F|nr:translation initiation factor IF-2-like [Trachypithecus francoisi]
MRIESKRQNNTLSNFHIPLGIGSPPRPLSPCPPRRLLSLVSLCLCLPHAPTPTPPPRRPASCAAGPSLRSRGCHASREKTPAPAVSATAERGSGSQRENVRPRRGVRALSAARELSHKPGAPRPARLAAGREETSAGPIRAAVVGGGGARDAGGSGARTWTRAGAAPMANSCRRRRAHPAGRKGSRPRAGGAGARNPLLEGGPHPRRGARGAEGQVTSRGARVLSQLPV